MRFWIRRPRRVEMTVRASEVRVGDLIRPSGHAVLEVTGYGDGERLVLITAAGRDRATSLHLPDDPIEIERHQ